LLDISIPIALHIGYKSVHFSVMVARKCARYIRSFCIASLHLKESKYEEDGKTRRKILRRGLR